MNKWEFAIIPCSVFILTVIATVTVSKMRYRSKRVITPMNILFVGIFLTCATIFFPLYRQMFADDIFSVKYIKTFILSIHHAIRLFVVDSDFGVILDATVGKEGLVPLIYVSFSALLYVLAPIMTFGFILYFFKNISAYRRYILCYFKEVFVFSELNEKTIELARSISENGKKCAFIFTDVFEKNEEASYELAEEARELGAICFKKDIFSLKLGFHSSKKKMTFFAIDEDETENLKQALWIIKQYRDVPDTELFVLSVCKEGELLLSNIDYGNMRVRRINPIRSLTYHLLYEKGKDIFDTAASVSPSEKEISAVIVGMGEHGFEMMKALTWFCQMDGYFVSIHAFDMDKNAGLKFEARCPELMSKEHNNQRIYDEAKYNITIHPDVDVETAAFIHEMERLQNVTYIYVALGDDRRNIETAVNLRALMTRMGLTPMIQAVVYDSGKNEALQGISCMGDENKGYNIDFVGSLRTIYSEKVIIRSEPERLALERHMKWSSSDTDFWKYEYNYRSSMASALHVEMRKKCQIPGAEKPPAQRTEEERKLLRIIEHNRWNAYMRSEGYCLGEKNHLSKTHPMLVPFHELPPEEQEKDDV